MLTFLAQIPVTPVDGIPSWASVILQGGAFALLVYIVTVMYPRATKEAKEEREKLAQQMAEERARMQDKQEKLQATFTNALTDLHSQFEGRNEKLSMAIKEQTVELARAFSDVCVYSATPPPPRRSVPPKAT